MFIMSFLSLSLSLSLSLPLVLFIMDTVPFVIRMDRGIRPLKN